MITDGFEFQNDTAGHDLFERMDGTGGTSAPPPAGPPPPPIKGPPSPTLPPAPSPGQPGGPGNSAWAGMFMNAYTEGGFASGGANRVIKSSDGLNFTVVPQSYSSDFNVGGNDAGIAEIQYSGDQPFGVYYRGNGSTVLAKLVDGGPWTVGYDTSGPTYANSVTLGLKHVGCLTFAKVGYAQNANHRAMYASKDGSLFAANDSILPSDNQYSTGLLPYTTPGDSDVSYGHGFYGGGNTGGDWVAQTGTGVYVIINHNSSYVTGTNGIDWTARTYGGFTSDYCAAGTSFGRAMFFGGRGGGNTYGHGYLCLSTDDGVTFVATDITGQGATSDFASFAFGPTSAIAVEDYGQAVWRTLDGGQTWSRSFVFPDAGVGGPTTASTTFSYRLHGLYIIVRKSYNGNMELWYSNDDATSFQQGVFPSLDTTIANTTIYAADNGTRIFCADQTNNKIYWTDDLPIAGNGTTGWHTFVPPDSNHKVPRGFVAHSHALCTSPHICGPQADLAQQVLEVLISNGSPVGNTGSNNSTAQVAQQVLEVLQLSAAPSNELHGGFA